jgi:antagonist of KipI
VLMADRPTTGGYAKIATVISVDVSLLAQAKPDDKIGFVETTVATAQSLYRERFGAIRRLAVGNQS